MTPFELFNQVGQDWAKIDAESKIVYEKLANDDKERYKQEIKQLKKALEAEITEQKPVKKSKS